MVLNEKIKLSRILILFHLLGFQAYSFSSPTKETYNLLLTVNSNWKGLENEIRVISKPNSEKELVKLHLLNVIGYIENKISKKLSKSQKINRKKNILILKKYVKNGVFPINNLTDYRTPIFIDSKGTHCAVGFLMKEAGFSEISIDIAKNQLLAYVRDIRHNKLNQWQKSSGLSLFELSLIQPTYGPPISVCATPSPISWKQITSENSGIIKFFSNKNNTQIYGVSEIGKTGLTQEIKKYSISKNSWKTIGNQINGQILNFVTWKENHYVSVLLPNEDFPYQILKLTKNSWIKVAHFNGSINSIQEFENQLYVLGNFNKVNDTIQSNFVVINDKSIRPFKAYGLRYYAADEIIASETSLFLKSGSVLYKFKNDTLKQLATIKYYQYIKSYKLDAVEDTLYFTSLGLPGYNSYYNTLEKTSHLNNTIAGQDYPYNSIHFSQSKIIEGNMVIAGDFKSSTLIPQINDERYLTDCGDTNALDWVGEGLIYEYNRIYYPILDKGIVIDFTLLNNQLFILKKDGNIFVAKLDSIKNELKKLSDKRSGGK